MATHTDFPLSGGAHPARYQVDQKYRRVTDPASRFQGYKYSGSLNLQMGKLCSMFYTVSLYTPLELRSSPTAGTFIAFFPLLSHFPTPFFRITSQISYLQ